MYRIRLSYVIAVLLCLQVSLFAAAPTEEMLLPHSQSPDGSKEISLTQPKDPNLYDEEESFLNIRDVKTGKPIFRCSWGSFGRVPDSFKVLWRPDGKCFVVGFAATRGFMATRIFAWTKRGWMDVEMPDFFPAVMQKAKVAGENRLTVDKEPGGKGHETAKEWLPNNLLKMDVGYRGIWEAGEEAYQGFWITLQIIDSNGKSKPKAILKSVELQPH